MVNWKSIRIKKGNYGFDLKFEVIEDGERKDLTGITPTLKVYRSGSLFLSKTCSVSGGYVVCHVDEGDFDEVGVYEAEIELSKEGYLEDTETFIIEVEPTV